MPPQKNKQIQHEKEMPPEKLAELKRREEEAEIEMHTKNAEGEAIMRAAKRGDADEVTRLCKQSKYPEMVNFKDGSSFTPLMKATMYDRTEVIRALVNLGADLELTEERGRTALMLAAANGFTASCELLTSCGAKIISPRANNGWHAPMFAAANAHDETTAFFLAIGDASVLAVEDKLGMTILDHARVAKDNPEMNMIDNEPAVIVARSQRIVALIEKAIENKHSKHSASGVSSSREDANSVSSKAQRGFISAAVGVGAKGLMRRLSLSIRDAASAAAAPARRMSAPARRSSAPLRHSFALSKQSDEPVTPPRSFEDEVEDSSSSPIIEIPVRKGTTDSKPLNQFATVVV